MCFVIFEVEGEVEVNDLFGIRSWRLAIYHVQVQYIHTHIHGSLMRITYHHTDDDDLKCTASRRIGGKDCGNR